MANDGLKIIHFNTQGFQNKVDSINKFVKFHNPDILVVTEHFQKSKKDLEKIDGYKIVNSFCRRHSERGGVAIWAKVEIPCTPRKDLDKHRKEREFELVSVGVGDDIVVTGAYRPPDTSIVDFHNNLAKYFKTINKEPNVKHVLTGDFNIDNRKHNSTRNILKNHNLVFNISSETHKDGACIDNFITNFRNSKTRVIKSKSSKFSDHLPIELIVEKEVNMIAEKEESLFWKMVKKIFFLKQKPGEDELALNVRTTQRSESCKSVFCNIYKYFFSGSSDTINSNTYTEIPKNKRKSELSDSSQLQSLISKLFSYFRPTSSRFSSSPSDFSKKNSNKKNMKNKNTSTKTVAKSESIFRKIINWFR